MLSCEPVGSSASGTRTLKLAHSHSTMIVLYYAIVDVRHSRYEMTNLTMLARAGQL